MNAKKFTVIGLVAFGALLFYWAMTSYQQRVQVAQDVQVTAEPSRLVRMHSPVFGPQDAPVTIVEFFDPACETCRAFYPLVKNLMAQHPQKIKLVIRYAAFHQGSDVVVKLLEAAKSQGKYQVVLEALLALEVVVLGLEPACHAMQLLVELVGYQGDGHQGEDEE